MDVDKAMAAMLEAINFAKETALPPDEVLKCVQELAGVDKVQATYILGVSSGILMMMRQIESADAAEAAATLN